MAIFLFAFHVCALMSSDRESCRDRFLEPFASEYSPLPHPSVQPDTELAASAAAGAFGTRQSDLARCSRR
jgi:hypothetical protein